MTQRPLLTAYLALSLAAGASVAIAAAPDVGSHVSVLTGEQVVQILDQTVEWYRTLGTQQQTASQPSDLLILYANQQTANQVIALAFDIARANAELLSSEASNAPDSNAPPGNASPGSAPPGSAAPTGDAAASATQIDESQKKLLAQRQKVESEMEATRRQLAGGKSDTRDQTEKLSELQGELAMMDARNNLLDTMAQFVSQTDSKTASANALKAHIDAIAMSVPMTGTAPVTSGTVASATGVAGSGAGGSTTAATPAASTAAPPKAAPAPATLFAAGNAPSPRAGIWDLASNALKLSEKISTIKAIDRGTAALESTFTKIRSKPVDQLKALAARSDALAAQADNAHGEALKSVRDQLDTLAWLFKQTSDILIPLSKEGVLLQQYRHNLKSWHDAARREYEDALVALGVRLGILLAMLAVVFAGGEVWRRLVLRYTPEPRRRYQLLLLRKLTLWTLVAVIVGLTFVTELSSFATFAGLLTAGVAVAMQSVLVSIVGYFFLIGKYGIRVGDRVQIGAVSGEVIDLGLVRMHLMEMNAQGPLGATGRVVAFANSIVFQASGGLFKQIPGVNFVWHETTLALPPGADHAALKERLLTVVGEVVQEFHEEIVRQTKQIEKTTASTSVGSPLPQVRLHFSPTGVDALVRYPVQLQHEAEIDERVSKELMKVIAGSVTTGQ
jgi:small-conductance mechanosensitive channel